MYPTKGSRSVAVPKFLGGSNGKAGFDFPQSVFRPLSPVVQRFHNVHCDEGGAPLIPSVAALRKYTLLIGLELWVPPRTIKKRSRMAPPVRIKDTNASGVPKIAIN